MNAHAPLVILGATGAVGREVLHILAARGISVPEEIRAVIDWMALQLLQLN